PGGDAQALARLGELRGVARLGLVHGRLDELEDGPEAGGVEVEVVGAAELLRPALGVRLARLDGDVLVEGHDRAHLTVAAGPDRRGPTAEVGVHRVVPDVETG